MLKNKICGIYKITSPSGRVYIGQSMNIIERWYSYRNLLCKKQIRLYRSLLKYGVDTHVFEIIHLCDKSELHELEIFYEKEFDSTSKDKGMNAMGCGNNGRTSEETKGRMSKSQLGRVMSEETKRKISKSHIGIGHTDETKQKLRELSRGNKYSLGRPVPEERRLRISQALKGKIRSSEAIKNAVNGRKGFKPSAETRQKMRLSNIGKKRTMEARKNISEAHKGIKQSKETIEKRSIKSRKIVLDIYSGVFYTGAREVSKLYGISITYLRSQLNGNAKNLTHFIYT